MEGPRRGLSAAAFDLSWRQRSPVPSQPGVAPNRPTRPSNPEQFGECWQVTSAMPTYRTNLDRSSQSGTRRDSRELFTDDGSAAGSQMVSAFSWAVG